MQFEINTDIFIPSDIFPKRSIALHPGVHFTFSSGKIRTSTSRSTETRNPLFELTYNLASPVSCQVGKQHLKLDTDQVILDFIRSSSSQAEYSAGTEIRLFSIWLHPGIFDQFLYSVTGKEHYGFNSFAGDAVSSYLFSVNERERQILNTIQENLYNTQKPINHLLLESQVLELISINLERLADPAAQESAEIHLTKTDRQTMEEAKKILDGNLDSPPSLGELSRSIHMNDCKMKRLFKQLYHCTIYEYIREMRLERAYSLIAYQGNSVSEAAFAVGYSSLGHFSRNFEKKYGILPGKLK